MPCFPARPLPPGQASFLSTHSMTFPPLSPRQHRFLSCLCVP
nr:MAG TPA: helicase [Caudoviricetes sp.]